MSMKHWWNDSDRGKLRYWERNMSQCHFFHHKCHMDLPGIEARPNRLSNATVKFVTHRVFWKRMLCVVLGSKREQVTGQ
jgi:hypothetical protein